jgi:DNA-binding CsgD family transcriptional regulator
MVDMLPVIVEGIRAWLRSDPRMVMGPVEAVGSDADVLVLDPYLDGQHALTKVSGLAGAGRRVIVFSRPTPEDDVQAILQAGARAFVTQSQERQHLIGAIIAVAGDRPPLDSANTAPPVAAPGRPAPHLSERERTTLLWWLRSMTKASVARRMGVSPHTVDMYIKRIRSKYSQVGRAVPTKADLLMCAIEDGLIEELPLR